MTLEERGRLGRTIAAILQYYFVQLINTIDLHVAANHLFGARIISDNQYDMATRETTESTKNKASRLILILIGKVEANPHMFNDVCVAFEQAGAKSIIREIKGNLGFGIFMLLNAFSLNLIIAEVYRQNPDSDVISPPAQERRGSRGTQVYSQHKNVLIIRMHECGIITNVATN